MKRFSNYLILVLQWVVFAWGIFTALMALHLYSIEANLFDGLSPARPGADMYSPPTLHRLVVGLCTGFATTGIGGILFYLRRLYLAR